MSQKRSSPVIKFLALLLVVSLIANATLYVFYQKSNKTAYEQYQYGQSIKTGYENLLASTGQCDEDLALAQAQITAHEEHIVKLEERVIAVAKLKQACELKRLEESFK